MPTCASVPGHIPTTGQDSSEDCRGARLSDRRSVLTQDLTLGPRRFPLPQRILLPRLRSLARPHRSRPRRRSLKTARPETDESLPHIGVVGDTYTIVLSGDDPGNADRQSALALVSWRTGFAWAQVEPKSKNEARAMVEKGRDILRQLKERTGLTAISKDG